MSAPISAFAKICRIVMVPSVAPVATEGPHRCGPRACPSRGVLLFRAGAAQYSRVFSYQLALRRPGTSPFIVALRSALRPRPNLLYTARGRPVRAQRVVWRLGEESRGSF